MTRRVARRKDHPSPARYVEAVAVLQVLVDSRGSRRSKASRICGLRSSISAEGLEWPLGFLLCGGIGGVRQHLCASLAYEGGP